MREEARWRQATCQIYTKTILFFCVSARLAVCVPSRFVPLVWFDGKLDTPQNRVKPTAALLPLWGGKTARYAKIPCKSDLHGRVSPDTLSRLVLT